MTHQWLYLIAGAVAVLIAALIGIPAARRADKKHVERKAGVREMSKRMEWVELQEDNFTVAFGRNGTDQQIYFRVLGKKDGAEAHIEWSFEAAWMRDLLAKWFPPIQDPRADAPRES